MPKLHEYHLDDAPDLRSCNLIVSALPGNSVGRAAEGAITDPQRRANFYGRSNDPRVRYVRERKHLDYGMAHEDEYYHELLDDAP